MTIVRVPGVDVRHTIALAMLESAPSVASRLGEVVLRAEQRAAAGRLLELIAESGGAMLADPVGLGKTYTALAVAAHMRADALIVTPASLRDMWRGALSACGMNAHVVTHEALSRGHTIDRRARVVIVDESHRFRTLNTRRYAALADQCRGAAVLLMTATPVHNVRTDLAAQLALFLGRRAWALTDADLARHVVRRGLVDNTSRPRLDGPHVVALPPQDEHLDAIVALPPPVPARDESTAATLLTYGLLHQWTSSRAALLAALERRRARGIALSAAIDGGRMPTRAELDAWTHADDAVQLAFPELVVGSEDADALHGLDALQRAVQQHLDALDRLRRRIRAAADPDLERAQALRRIRASHPGERIIAFAQYAETVATLRAHLVRDAGIATLTSHGARLASGRVSRAEVLEQFVPNARPASAATRIDLLICTDLLSEGLNLQEASVIVHLDMPWNPARLEQRVGRALRMGSRHSRVTVYSFSPPASAAALLRIETRLRDKLAIAQRTVGVAGSILPSPFATPRAYRGMAEELGEIRSAMRQWLERGQSAFDIAGPICGAVGADTPGFLALLHDGDRPHLIADMGSGASDAPAVVRAAVAAACGDDLPLDASLADSALRGALDWLAEHRASSVIDLRAAGAARARRATLERVTRALARAPRHRRSTLAPLAAAARAVATAPLGEGAERVLEMLVRAELPDEAWLRSIVAFGEINAQPLAPLAREPSPPRVVAIIVLTPRGASEKG